MDTRICRQALVDGDGAGRVAGRQGIDRLRREQQRETAKEHESGSPGLTRDGVARPSGAPRPSAERYHLRVLRTQAVVSLSDVRVSSSE